MQDNVLILRNYRYLKIAAALVVLAIAIYLWHEPLGEPNGGTWLGYTLGTIGALLIVWLAWFGVRKRRYGVGRLPLQDWLSAHVYLGLSLLVIATLHAGFQIGWNVHTLAYALMILVILSGGFGIYLYLVLPDYLAGNRGSLTLNEIIASIAELDQDCLAQASKLSDDINDLVREAAENTRIGGGVWRQLSGRDPGCRTASAVGRIGGLAEGLPADQANVCRELTLKLARKSELLQMARHDVGYRAWLNVWLIVHVPLTIALLVALAVHVISVFFYW